MNGKSLIAVWLTMLVALSVLTTGGVATEGQSPTEIDECTTITEPGHYELTQNITYWPTSECIQVEADDVTIDGNGHGFHYDQNKTLIRDPAPAINVSNQTNVAIRSVRLDKRVRVTDSTNITLEHNRNLEGGLLRIERLTIRSNVGGDVHIEDVQGLQVRDNLIRSIKGKGVSGGLSIVDNRVEDRSILIQSISGDVTVVNNHLDRGRIAVQDVSGNVTMRDNYGGGALEVRLTDGEAIVVNNTLDDNNTLDEHSTNHWGNRLTVSGGEGTSYEAARNYVANGKGSMRTYSSGTALVHNNTIENVTDTGLHLDGDPDTLEVTHNTVTDAEIGVEIRGHYDTGPALTLERNTITNNHIGVWTHSNLPEIHHNDLSANSEYGVRYDREHGVVNATQNYWGGRPSSPDDKDAPFEDPVTETLADGSGTAVSKGSAPAGAEEGVSNVHFDPWLDSAPGSGDDQATGGDDDSDDTTTTTTSTTTTTTTSEETTTSTSTTTTASDETTSTTTERDTTTTTTGDETTTVAGDEETATTRAADDGTTTTAATDEETTTTSPAPTGNQTTIITGTTATDTPGFGHLIGIIALIGGALLAARPT